MVFCYGRNKFKWFPIWAFVNKSAMKVHVHVRICDLLWMCVSGAFEEYQEVEFHLWAPVSPLELLPSFRAVPHPERPHSPPDALCRVPSAVVFFFFFWLIYFWLHWVFAAAFGLFSSCEEQGASHCGGFSGGARVPGTGRLQQVQHTGSLIVAPKLQVPRLRSSIGG